MPENEGAKLNRVEEMKDRLFNNSYKTEIKPPNVFSPLPSKEVPESWGQEDSTNEVSTSPNKFPMKTSHFKKFFFFSLLFFLGATGYASHMFFAGGNIVSNKNIDISVLGNTFTAGGEDLSLIIEITNRNNSALDLVDLVVEYPRSSSASALEDTERIRESLGSIPAGGVRSENLKVVLYGEQGSKRKIKISIEYRVEGSNAIFVKNKEYDVSINSSPINLSFEAPNQVSSNQIMTLNVKAILNANKVVDDVLLKVDYPVGFEYLDAQPAPSLGDNIWSLDDLAPGSERNIVISGQMIDATPGEEKTFRVWSGTQSLNDKSSIGVVFNSLSNLVTINKASIEAKLYVGGAYERQYSSGSKETINAEIRWVNNLDTQINDMEIRAKLFGNALDRKKITAERGFYNSSLDTIVWDRNSERGFDSVGPGESGSLIFSFLPSTTSATGLSLIDPSISIEVSISGKQSGDGFALNDLSNKEIKVVKISTDVGFATKALYATSAFVNTGPVPPKAEKETTYTIVWSLSNSSNNISKASVRSFLPPWVRFTGKISPGSEDVTYDAGTKQIVWNVGNLPKGSGVSRAQKEVSFQVAFTPSLSQVGTSPVIINDAVLTGQDDFAKVNVVINKSSLSTRLISDANFPVSGSEVVE